MAIIPNGQKFQTLTDTVDTTEKRSKSINDNQATFTMADISETVNAGGGSLPYSSTIIKVTQSGSDTPSVSFLSNEIGISFVSVFVSTGVIYLNMTPGTYPSDENTMAIAGDFHNGFSSNSTIASAVHNGQSIVLRTYIIDNGGACQLSDLGAGGTESIIIELRDFS